MEETLPLVITKIENQYGWQSLLIGLLGIFGPITNFMWGSTPETAFAFCSTKRAHTIETFYQKIKLLNMEKLAFPYREWETLTTSFVLFNRAGFTGNEAAFRDLGAYASTSNKWLIKTLTDVTLPIIMPKKKNFCIFPKQHGKHFFGFLVQQDPKLKEKNVEVH